MNEWMGLESRKRAIKIDNTIKSVNLAIGVSSKYIRTVA